MRPPFYAQLQLTPVVADARARGGDHPRASGLRVPLSARRGTASGKVILFGEHAVVYGHEAIAAGIPEATWAQARPASGGPSRLHVDAFGLDVTDRCDHEVGRAFRELLEITAHETGRRAPFHVTAHTCLPAGGGLGSSASLGVAIARALDPGADDDTVVARATAWERIFHGTPSGVDTAAAARGGLLVFRKGEPCQTLGIGQPLVLCVGHGESGASTKMMVAHVAAQRAAMPSVADGCLRRIGDITAHARRALVAGNVREVGALLLDNHHELRKLGVSTHELDTLTSLAIHQGALGAKLTGAGGGGSVVALAPSVAVAAVILEAWREAGAKGFVTQVDVGAAGLAGEAGRP